MSLTSSLGLEALALDLSAQGCEPLPSARLIRTAEPSLESTGLMSQSLKTCEASLPWTWDQLTLSVEDSPARTSASPGRARGSLASAQDCGESTPVLLAKYDRDTSEWHCIPASAVGAPHRRDRVWIIAYANGDGLEENTNQEKLCDEAQEYRMRRHTPMLDRAREWDGTRPSGAKLFRVGNGVSSDVDRLKALGNAVVPQIPELIGRAIMRTA
jgi:hypothetical protein